MLFVPVMIFPFCSLPDESEIRFGRERRVILRFYVRENTVNFIKS